MLNESSPSFCLFLRARAQDGESTKGERTRATIRWAIAALLEESGYALFSLDSVAKKAGVSRPAIYQYYSNKRDCVFDVLSEFLNLVYQFVENDTDKKRVKPGDLLTAVTATNRKYIAFYRQNAVLIERVRELREEIPELIAIQQDVNRRWAERLADHIVHHTKHSAKHALLTAYALESMIDDFLRELFVLKNPHLAGMKLGDQALARGLSEIWIRAAYGQGISDTEIRG